jgi:hypothetical protein
MKNHIKIIMLLSCISALLMSCSSKQNKIKYLICRDSIQYWDLVSGNGDLIKCGSGLKKNSIVKSFQTDENGNRWVSRDCENLSAYKCEVWSITKDSIFTTRLADNGFVLMKMKILKCSFDTIYGKNLKNRGMILFVRVRDLKSIINSGDKRDTIKNAIKNI